MQIFGQISHIDIDSDLEEGQSLWRYMDLSKFISLLDEKAIWLARADTFRDQHEGKFPDEMRKAIISVYESLKHQQSEEINLPIVRDADDFQDYLRKNTFISCWHKNFDESMVMWEIYGKDANALSIQTTVSKLKESISPLSLHGFRLQLNNVLYIRSDEIDDIIDYEDCFLIKRPHFDFEKEVRICLDTYDHRNPKKDTPTGYNLHTKINDLIENIYIHPDAPDWFMKVIESITNKYGVNAPVIRGKCGNR